MAETIQQYCARRIKEIDDDIEAFERMRLRAVIDSDHDKIRVIDQLLTTLYAQQRVFR